MDLEGLDEKPKAAVAVLDSVKRSNRARLYPLILSSHSSACNWMRENPSLLRLHVPCLILPVAIDLYEKFLGSFICPMFTLLEYYAEMEHCD